jgi:hypothetical protein
LKYNKLFELFKIKFDEDKDEEDVASFVFEDVK